MRNRRDFRRMFSRVFAIAAVITVLSAQNSSQTQPKAEKNSSYMPVVETETFAAVRNRMSAAKPTIMKRQMDLLADRYDLSNRPAAGVAMDRSKPVQDGVRVKLPSGMTWAQLAGMTPQQIRDRDSFPRGFLPLPTPTILRAAWSSRSSNFRN